MTLIIIFSLIFSSLLQIPAASFLASLPKLLPRSYSIASFDPKPVLFKGQEILFTDILINVVEFKSGPFLVHEPDPKLRKGVASNFLTKLPIGGKFLSCHQFNDHFTMPEDLSLPLIMICAGSGIAPFRHNIYSWTVSS